MHVQHALVVDLNGLILREEPYFDALVVEHALVGLAHGDGLLYRLAGGYEHTATVGSHTVHEYLQSVGIGLLLHHELIHKVEALVGGGLVGQVQRELSRAASRYVGQRGLLGRYAAVGAHLYDGLFHLLRSVGDDVLFLRLIVLGVLQPLVGVVALSAAQQEDVAPATR